MFQVCLDTHIYRYILVSYSNSSMNITQIMRIFQIFTQAVRGYCESRRKIYPNSELKISPDIYCPNLAKDKTQTGQAQLVMSASKQKYVGYSVLKYPHGEYPHIASTKDIIPFPTAPILITSIFFLTTEHSHLVRQDHCCFHCKCTNLVNSSRKRHSLGKVNIALCAM